MQSIISPNNTKLLILMERYAYFISNDQKKKAQKTPIHVYMK